MDGRFFRSFFKWEDRENRLCGDIKQLIERILEEKLSDIKIAAALVCLKQHKSPYVYGKALDVVRGYIKKVEFSLPDSIEVGYPYFMKKSSPYFLIPASIVLSLLPRSDIKTVFHGESLRKQSTKAIFDFLDLTLLTNDDSISMLKHLNIGFFNRSLFLPELSSLNRIRDELGINDIFSYIEKFLNPVGSKYLITGVKTEKDLEFYSELLKRRYKSYAIVLNRDGFPDITGFTKVFLYIDNDRKEIDLSVFDTGKFSYPEFDPKSHSQFIIDLLSKKLKDYEKLLFVNGGILLLLRGVTNSLREGYEITEELFGKYDFSQILRNIQRYSDYLNYKNVYEL